MFLSFLLSLEERSSSSKMGESEPLLQLNTVEETEEPTSNEQSMVSTNRSNYKRWLRIGSFTLCVLSSQSIATLLGRLYFEKGGKSLWLETLVELAGFPILIFYHCFSPLRNTTVTNSTTSTPPSAFVLASVYVSLGLLVAAFCFLYTTGVRYLHVSTFSLISTSQLAFTAIFSYFLNSQKFTPFIVNSIILLTISSVLVSLEGSSNYKRVSRVEYVIGFLCTVAASALNAFELALAQLYFRKVIKTDSFSAVMDMIIYQSLVAASAIAVGFFVSGEWKGLKGEMEEYELGTISYIMVLVWISILGQGYVLGGTSLLFEVSSLFSNAVSSVTLPVTAILAVIFFDDEMDVTKVVAMFLAILGVCSYGYQQYLDDQESKAQLINVNNEA